MSAALGLLAALTLGDVPLRPSLELRAAPPSSTLSLDEVLASAHRAFPPLDAATADLDAADADALAAAGAFDPTWRTRAAGVPAGDYPQLRLDSTVEVPTPLWGSSFFGGYRLGVGKFQPYYGERETWSGGELRAGVLVPVLRNGPTDRRRTTLARAEIARSLARLSREQQRLEVTRLATARYWDWVAAGQRRQVVRGLLELALARDAQLAVRTGVGDAPRFDQQDNRRAVAQREAALVQAQRGVEAAAFELSLFWRDARGEPLLPGDDLLPGFPAPPVEPAFDFEAVLARRPDVTRLTEQRRSAQLEVELQKNQLLPALDVGVAVSGDLGRPGAFGSTRPVELELTAGLEVPLLYRAPLGRLRSAEAAVRKLDAQLQFARERARVDVDDGLSALRRAVERAETTRREVEAAVQVEQGERRRFELGEGTLLFVNLREQATAEARLREIDARLEGLKALATLGAALALDSPSGSR